MMDKLSTRRTETAQKSTFIMEINLFFLGSTFVLLVLHLKLNVSYLHQLESLLLLNFKMQSLFYCFQLSCSKILNSRTVLGADGYTGQLLREW